MHNGKFEVVSLHSFSCLGYSQAFHLASVNTNRFFAVLLDNKAQCYFLQLVGYPYNNG